MDSILRLLARAANVDHIDDNEPLPPDIAAQDKGPGIIVTILSLTSITTLFVIARLYTRARVLRAAHLDDWLIIVSMACTWVAAGFSVAANLKGAGRHVRALTQQELHDAIFFVMTGFVPSLLSFAFPKLAIVALLTRLMNPSRIHRRFLWVLAGSCFVVLCTNIIVEFAQCNPVSALWDKSIKKEDKSCWDPRVNLYTAYFAGAYSAFVDMYLAVYPTIVLFRLQSLSWRKKAALSIALGLGVFASIVAIYKCTFLPALGSKDYTYDTAELVAWTSVESNTLIMATCIPVLRPLIDRIFGRHFLGDRSDPSRPGYGGGYQTHRGDKGYALGRSGARQSWTTGSPTAADDHELVISPVHPKRNSSVRSTAVIVASERRQPSSAAAHYYAAAIKNPKRLVKRSDTAPEMGNSDLGTKASNKSASQESILQLGRAMTTPGTTAALGPGFHQHQHKGSGGARVLTITGQAGAGISPRAGSTLGNNDDMADGTMLPIMRPPRGQIVRTDIVTVSYDDAVSSKSEGDGGHSPPDDPGAIVGRGRRSSSDAARSDGRLWWGKSSNA
ncbi:hypothetical protein RB595_003943 [Gaeumannomyces hyphopodioides]